MRENIQSIQAPILPIYVYVCESRVLQASSILNELGYQRPRALSDFSRHCPINFPTRLDTFLKRAESGRLWWHALRANFVKNAAT